MRDKLKDNLHSQRIEKEEMTQDEYNSSLDCMNCDEID